MSVHDMSGVFVGWYKCVICTLGLVLCVFPVESGLIILY
jgi:hypothetical protein